MIAAAMLFFVHVVASDVIFLVLKRFLRGMEKPSSIRIFALTRGLGPAAVSLMSYQLLIFLPGRTRSAYLFLILSAFVLAGAMHWKQARALAACYRRLGRTAWEIASQPQIPMVVAALFLLAGTIFGVVYPIVEHDALAAMVESRIALRDSSFDNYKAVRVPDPETGFYATTIRTPFLQSLNVFFAWGAGSDAMDLLARTTSPIFAIHLLLLLSWCVRRETSLRAAAWASLLLAVTPIFFDSSYNNGIDTVRLYLVLAALLWLVELAAAASWRVAVVSGLVAGLALFSHPLSFPSLAGGILAFLFCSNTMGRRRALLAGLVAAVAFVAGAQAHYFSTPPVADAIRASARGQKKQFDEWRMHRASVVAERRARGRAQTQIAADKESEPQARELGAVESPAAPPSVAAAAALPAAADETLEPVPATARPKAITAGVAPRNRTLDFQQELLERRGQGRTAWSGFLFGRLQMFTGVEYFGLVFYLFVGSFLLRSSNGGKRTSTDRILLGSALLAMLVVLSGLRKLSWSNPRYIASVLPVAVYFAAPVLARFEARSRIGKAAVLAILILPVSIATTVRGAKLGITSSGTFYSDFRSLRWVSVLHHDPRGAVATFWKDYVGLRKSLAYLTADRDTQLREAHDYLAATLWVRDHLPSDSRLLVFRDARFFYYGERRAVYCHSPEVAGKRYRTIETGRAMRDYLWEVGIDHVLVDDASTRMPGYADRAIGVMLADRRVSRLLFEYGRARVYELAEPGTSIGTEPDRHGLPSSSASATNLTIRAPRDEPRAPG